MRGVVIFITSGIAHIYSPNSPVELLLDLRTTARHISIGEWLECNAYKTYVEYFKRIEPGLTTRVVDGKVQLETRIRIDYNAVTVESEHFGKVAFLGSRPSLKLGHVYKCFVQRDPDQFSGLYTNLNVKWHVVPSTVVEIGDVPMPKNPSWVKPNAFQRPVQSSGQLIQNNSNSVDAITNQLNQTYLAISVHNGVIVGKRGHYFIIYCRTGFMQMTERWKREATPLDVGQWLEFKSKKVDEKKHIIDSNSWREIPPLHITKVNEKGEVVLTVPCYVKNGKVQCNFIRDVTGTPCTERLRSCRAVAYSDEKGRFRWKMIEKLPTVVTSKSMNISLGSDKIKNTEKLAEISQDFTKDIELQWKNEKMERPSILTDKIMA